jgi:hypothetical protein
MVTQVLAAAGTGYSQRTLGYSLRTAQPGGGEFNVVTPTLKWYEKYFNSESKVQFLQHYHLGFQRLHADTEPATEIYA